MASIESRSSCDPHANCQPEPPMAQAPYPTGVICKSELPRVRMFIPVSMRFWIHTNWRRFSLTDFLNIRAASSYRMENGDHLWHIKHEPATIIISLLYLTPPACL